MAAEPSIVHEPVPCAVVAVSVGDGVRRIFQSLGVQVVVTGGQTMNPSTAQLLEAVESAPAPDVVLLPNNKNIIPVAEQVDAMTDKTVRVVPTRGVAEGFASLLAYDPGAVAGTAIARDVGILAHLGWAYIVPLAAPLLPGFTSARASGSALARLLTDPSVAPRGGQYLDYRLRPATLWAEAHRSDWQDDLMAACAKVIG